MIDHDARARLRIALAQLVDGQMTNNEFDVLYYSEWEHSLDRGVAAIAKFGWSLYSSDVGEYRLNRWHKVSAETRRIAERCLLFLQAGLEYAWPDPPDGFLLGFLPFLLLFFSIPLGIALLFVALGLWLSGEPMVWSAGLAAAGAGVVAGNVLLDMVVHYRARKRFQTTTTGDVECWPFFERQDLAN